jgi:myo-inositol-1(or 4)-monophosphatase
MGNSDPREEFDLTELSSVAIEAAESASAALLARFRPPAGAPLELNYKGPGDVVTDADLAADRAIAQVLESRGAPGNVLSEESSIDKGDTRLTWLIDPLCGTLPFSSGLPHWGVNVALRIGDELEIGVVALPTSNEILSAVRGQGAYVNGVRLNSQEPPGDPRNTAVSFDADGRRLTPAKRALSEVFERLYSFASAAYPMGQLLQGRLHGAVFNELNVHTAASVVIARELGVRVTDENGNDAVWASNTSAKYLVFAWPRTHEAMMEALRSLPAEPGG